MTGPSVPRDRDVACDTCETTWTVYGTGPAALRAWWTHFLWHHSYVAEWRALQDLAAVA